MLGHAGLTILGVASTVQTYAQNFAGWRGANRFCMRTFRLVARGCQVTILATSSQKPSE